MPAGPAAGIDLHRVVSEPLSDSCGGNTPAPASTSAPGRRSAGCRAPRQPACCCRARTAGCPATGWCGGTSSAAMAPARVTAPSAPIPAPSATSWRRSRWHGTGRHRTRGTRPCIWRCRWRRRRAGQGLTRTSASGGSGSGPGSARAMPGRITDPDFALARHIGAIAAGHGAGPGPAGDAWLPRPGCAAAAPLMPVLQAVSVRRYSGTFMSLRSSDHTCRPWAGPRKSKIVQPERPG